MSETRTDKRAEFGEPDNGSPLSPAAMAGRVTMLVDDGASIGGGLQPMWDQMDTPLPRSRLSRFVLAAAWCATLALLTVAVLRVVCHDATVPLIWLNAFTLYIYLPGYAVLAFAAWKRRWWLATASVVVVACHLTWVAPDFRPATPYVPPVAASADRSPPIKIFYANVRGGINLNMEGVLAEVRRNNPDIIVLAEMQRWWWLKMIDTNPLKEYPYGTNLHRRNAGDVGVFSRLPVSRMEQIPVEHRTSLAIDVPLGAETLRLFVLHSPRPLLQMDESYYKFWQQIEPYLAEEHGPLVAIGDFNATQHSLVYKQLRADGLRSAHEDRGRGYATTWSNGVHPIPPIRIDQAFLSPQVECVSIVEGVGPGSDHKPLILDLRVHATEPTQAAR